MKTYKNLHPVTSIRLRPEEKEKLQRLAEKEGITLVDWVRKAINEAKV